MKVNLGALSVLVGPNGAGKSNLLSAIRFLGDTARLDLLPALNHHGGFRSLRYRGEDGRRASFRLAVHAEVTEHASASARDEYAIVIQRYDSQFGDVYHRRESFRFKRTPQIAEEVRKRGLVDTRKCVSHSFDRFAAAFRAANL